MTLDVIQGILSKIDADFLLKLSPGLGLLAYSIYSFSSSLKDSKDYAKENSLRTAASFKKFESIKPEKLNNIPKYNFEFEDFISFRENLKKVGHLNSIQRDICAAIGVEVLELYGIRVFSSNLDNTSIPVNNKPVLEFKEEFSKNINTAYVNTFDGFIFESFGYAKK